MVSVMKYERTPFFLTFFPFFSKKLNYTSTLRPECQTERTLVSTRALVEVITTVILLIANVL